MKKYPIKFTDKFGAFESVITTNGSLLEIKLRDTLFTGQRFDCLKTNETTDQFEFSNENELTNFKMEIKFDIQIEVEEKASSNDLTLDVSVKFNKKISEQVFSLSNINFKTDFIDFNLKKTNDFESVLVKLQNKLTKDYRVKSCVSCKHSYYNPLGNLEFGELYCFKNWEESKIENKSDLLDVFFDEDDLDPVFNVQETFDCSEHQFITKKRDYYVFKDWDISCSKYLK